LRWNYRCTLRGDSLDASIQRIPGNRFLRVQASRNATESSCRQSGSDSMSTADAEVMAGIRAKWQVQLAAAVHASSLGTGTGDIRTSTAPSLGAPPPAPPSPEAFLAAIVANEDAAHGGDPRASRFEPAVFIRLVRVAAGQQASFNPPGAYRPLTQADLFAYASPGEVSFRTGTGPLPGPPPPPDGSPLPPPGSGPHGLKWGLLRLQELATSFGLTQIMAWHLLEFKGMAGFPASISDLQDPAKNLSCAVALLSYFVEHYQLAWDAYEELFRCWNTGEPNGATFDPQYVPNGLARMAAYAAL
jgi:hypothetical protein